MGTDRTGEFFSLCMRCRVQQSQNWSSGNYEPTNGFSLSSPSSLAFVFDHAFPSPPFSFAPAAIAAASSSTVADSAAAAADCGAAEAEASAAALLRCCFPIPAETFVFLLLAARCAETQEAIEQQLHPLVALGPRGNNKIEEDGQDGTRRRDPVVESDAAAANEVSRLLDSVRQQQQQLQQLEQQTNVLNGVTELAKVRLQWEKADARRQNDLGFDCTRGSTWRSSVVRNASPWKGRNIDTDWKSATIAHRKAIVGCLYTSLQALTEELKKKEVTILQAQLEKERYFSAYGFLGSSTAGTQQEGSHIQTRGSTTAAKIQQPIQTSTSWMRMQSHLAAAAAARAAEQVLAAQQHKKERDASNILRNGIVNTKEFAAGNDDNSKSGRISAAYSSSHLESGTDNEYYSSGAAERSMKTGFFPNLRQRQQGRKEVHLSNPASAGDSGQMSSTSSGGTCARGGGYDTSSHSATQAPNTCTGIYSSVSGKRSTGIKGGTHLAVVEEEEEKERRAIGTEREGMTQGDQQLLLLQEEEQQLVESFVNESDLVLDVQRKLQEIIQCMDIFSSKVLEQSAACEYIHEQAEISVEHVTAAEQHLQSSLQRSAAYRYYIFLFFIGAGLLLLLLDFLKSSSPYI